jgi:hypothetical protein
MISANNNTARGLDGLKTVVYKKPSSLKKTGCIASYVKKAVANSRPDLSALLGTDAFSVAPSSSHWQRRGFPPPQHLTTPRGAAPSSFKPREFPMRRLPQAVQLELRDLRPHDDEGAGTGLRVEDDSAAAAKTSTLPPRGDLH